MNLVYKYKKQKYRNYIDFTPQYKTKTSLLQHTIVVVKERFRDAIF